MDLITLVGIAITAGVIYLIKLGANLITAKIRVANQDAKQIDRVTAGIGLDIAERAVQAAAEVTVGKLEELLAKDLRKKIQVGEASREELEALAGTAYKEIMEIIKPEIAQGLAGSFQNVDLYIQNEIENQLTRLKAALQKAA
jgi:hypothetical protein